MTVSKSFWQNSYVRGTATALFIVGTVLPTGFVITDFFRASAGKNQIDNIDLPNEIHSAKIYALNVAFSHWIAVIGGLNYRP